MPGQCYEGEFCTGSFLSRVLTFRLFHSLRQALSIFQPSICSRTISAARMPTFPVGWDSTLLVVNVLSRAKFEKHQDAPDREDDSVNTDTRKYRQRLMKF